MIETQVNVRYMVSDVQESVDWYVGHFGFAVQLNAAPAFASVEHGALRLLLSGRAASAGVDREDRSAHGEQHHERDRADENGELLRATRRAGVGGLALLRGAMLGLLDRRGGLSERGGRGHAVRAIERGRIEVELILHQLVEVRAFAVFDAQIEHHMGSAALTRGIEDAKADATIDQG